ncbi:MAG: hypothetical protein EOM24_23070, partial [Chloroflexia bacterium]|nr:hypothetical protein [Chloroflexia bacterium]
MSDPLPVQEPVALQTALAAYQAAMAAVTTAPPAEHAERLLALLLARDHLDAILAQHPPCSATTLEVVLQTDAQLRAIAPVLGATVGAGQCERWQATLHPPPDHWWWALLSGRYEGRNSFWSLLIGTVL